MRLQALITTVGALFLSLQQGWLSNAAAWWGGVSAGRYAPADTPTLQGQIITTVLTERQRLGVSPLMPDPVVQHWLVNQVRSGESDPDLIAQSARRAWPQYQEVMVVQTSSLIADGILRRIAAWPDVGMRDVSHFCVVVEPGSLGLGWNATVLAGLRLPMFSPEALDDPKQDKFYSTCTLCNHGQPTKVPRHARSFSLKCPLCDRVYAMLAADSHGRFRYVNEYLTGYAPPARFPRGQTKLAELMTIWRAVVRQCHYLSDAADDDKDAWQTAEETQALGLGDCEDSSILLTDWLLVRGFRARVAIGRYAERGAHAWVVVQLDGKDYLLESTEYPVSTQRPPLLKEVGSRYVPELLFDRLAIFIRKKPDSLWNGDFWGEKTWQRVVSRPAPSKEAKIVSQ